MKAFFKKSLFSLLTLMLIISILELVLWSAGTLYLDERSSENNISSHHIRILCLGDSFTYGIGVEKTATYPGQLQKKLSERGCRVHVINRGIPGLNSSYINANMEKYIRDISPDVVLFMGGINNSWNITDTNRYEGAGAIISGIGSLLMKSRLYRFLKIAVFSLKTRDKIESEAIEINDGYIFMESIKSTEHNFAKEKIVDDGTGKKHIKFKTTKKGPVPIEKSKERLIRDVENMKEICDKNNVIFIAMTYPTTFSINKTLLETSSNKGIPVIDNGNYLLSNIPEKNLPEYFRKEKGPMLWSHPTEKGYALMSENIAALLPRMVPALASCHMEKDHSHK